MYFKSFLFTQGLNINFDENFKLKTFLLQALFVNFSSFTCFDRSLQIDEKNKKKLCDK